MTSQSLAIAEMMVVSDIGEQWSPNTPPDITAPAQSAIFASIPTAIGMAIGIMMLKVPQLVPVENEITEAKIKIIPAKK
jgi:hypothetical protein